MYHTEMNSPLDDFGPALVPADLLTCQQTKPETSFEDEVENIYFSETPQEQDTDKMPTGITTMNNGLINYKVETDAELVSVKPEDVTGQSVAPRHQDQDVYSMLEANFDLSTLLDNEMDCSPVMESTTIEADEGVEETQDVIDEIQEFLNQFPQEPVAEENELATLAEELLSDGQQQTLKQMPDEFPTTNLGDAEELLDMLLATDTEPQQQQTDILQSAMNSSQLFDDSGFVDEPKPKATYKISNMTQFVGSDGQKVIIVVQPAQQVSQPAVVAASDDASDFAEDSDPEWIPDVATVEKKKPGRKIESRASLSGVEGGRVKKQPYRGITDRKKRKKVQNVIAARRYRDKKKQEETEIEIEEKKLLVKNQALKERLTDIENEFKTMKKLVVELGLLKVVKKT